MTCRGGGLHKRMAVRKKGTLHSELQSQLYTLQVFNMCSQ